MTVTFVGAGVAATANNASVAPALHASTAVGDAVLVFASIRNSGTGTPDLPDGYTLLLDMANAALFGKIATAGEGAPTITFTGGAANADTIAQTATFRGLRLSVLDSDAALNGSAQNISYPALTITEDNCLALVLGWKQDDWTSVAGATGTEIGEPDTTTGDDAGQVWNYTIQTTAANISASSFTVTGGASAISRGGTIALRAIPAFATIEQDVYPPRVLLVATGLGIGDDVELYRVVAGERTLVRAGSADSITDTSFLRVDAELPFGVAVSYVLVVNGDDLGTDGPDTYTLPGGKVALTDAISGAAAEVVILAWDEKNYATRASTFRVGGRNVVVSEPVNQFDGPVELYTQTTTARDNLFAVLEVAAEGIVQIRQPGGYAGVDCYLAVVGAAERRFSQDGSDQRRVIVLQAVEVESWAAALEASGFTLQDIADVYDGLTLDDIEDDYATLVALAQGDFST